MVSMFQPKELIKGYLFFNVILIGFAYIGLPGNTTMLDFLNLVCLPLLWIYIAFNKVPLRFPLYLPISLITVTGIYTAMVSLNPSDSLMVIIKEIYIYIWFVTLVIILSHSISTQNYQKMLFVWMVVATAQAILIILQFGFEVSRPLGLFQNPNLAASYLLISLFMGALASSSLRWIRVISLVVMCVGIFATGSRASMVAAVFGCLTILAFPSFKKLCFLDKKSIVVVKMLVIFLVVSTAIIVIAQSSIIRHSIRHDVNDRYYPKYSRTNLLYSVTDRVGTWAEGLYRLSKGNIFLGLGQDTSKEALSISENITGILRPQSMHSDLTSFLVERGVLGLLGFLILCICIADRILRQFRFESYSGVRSSNVAILMGGCVAMVVISLVHQAFHFRHFWFFLAILFSNSFHAPSTEKRMYPTVL